MHPARIAELLQPFLAVPAISVSPDHCHSEKRSDEACPERSRREPAVLSPAQLQSISTYIDILLRWNARINLTAIRDPEQIVTRHFGESLFAARHLSPPTAASPAAERRQNAAHGASRGSAPPNEQAPEGRKRRSLEANDQRQFLACPERSEGTNDRLTLADLGSGAGFPGLPIRLWAPHISLTLIESSHKKATFLREVTRALTLTDVNILTTRAEDLSPVHRFDVVTARAVEHFENILPAAANLLAPAGRLALLVSLAQVEEAHKKLPTFTWCQPIPIPESHSRTLLIGACHPNS